MMRTFIFIALQAILFLFVAYQGTAHAEGAPSPDPYVAEYAPGACSLVPASKTCVDAVPCKFNSANERVCLHGLAELGAFELPQTCWQYSYKFSCNQSPVDTCTSLANNSKCTINQTSCADKHPVSGKCLQYNYTYQCITKDAVTRPALSCLAPLFKPLPVVLPTPDNAAFVRAALAAEIARQAATYNKDGVTIFSGVRESCRKGYAGIKDCCKSTPGAQANSEIVGLALATGASVAKYAGAKLVDLASPYVFDAMYTAGEYTAGLVGSLSMSAAIVDAQAEVISTNFAAGGLSLSAYGFTYSSTVVANGTGFMGGSTQLASFGQGSSQGFLSFNPYVFGAMVALQVIQSFASCNTDEQMLALHRGANLSESTGEYCSKQLPGSGILSSPVCLEFTDTFCSFNSVLAKIINTQGKPQLGLPLSDCKGFTTDQLGQLDFKKINFSEFTTSLTSRASNYVPPNPKADFTPIIQNTKQGSGQSTSIVSPSYPPPGP